MRRGWNRASEIYRSDGAADDVFRHTAAEHARWLRPLFVSLAPGRRVLELGCGCGVPDAAHLAERFQVLGVDLSDRQIRRARRLVPRARFRRAEMTRLRLPDRSFDAIVCLYSLIHVPRERHEPLFRRMHRWLTPGGWLIVITGETAYEGIEDDWLESGRPMFWSHADAATYRAWLERSGFVIRREEVVPEQNAAHHLFVARSGAGRATIGRAHPPKTARVRSARRRIARLPRPIGPARSRARS